MVLYRNSASPADGDVIGRIDYRGKDDGAVDRDYITLYSKIADASTGSAGGSFHIQTRTGATTGDRFVVGGNGNIGIGTSSPSESLTNRGNIFIETNSTSANSGNGLFWQSTTNGWSTSTAHAAIYGKRTDASNGYLRFDTRQSGTTQEAMRIDASGNLLVGTTTTYPAGAGVSGAFIEYAGRIEASRASATAIRANRNTTDGDIAEFRKDGTTVGSIGVSGGNNPYFSSGVANHGGLAFSDGGSSTPQMNPISSGSTLVNGAMNIGSPSYRFKDLYLSGGVYLGGTGSANQLDDYEEGTFTPVVVGGTQTASVVSAHYTKIGRLVTLNVYIQLNNVTNSTALSIGGFPFTVDGYTATNIVNAQYNDTDRTPLIRSQSSSTQAEVIYATGNQLAVTQTNLTGNFIFTLTYEQQ